MHTLEFLCALFTGIKMPGYCLYLLRRQIIQESKVELYDSTNLWTRVASHRYWRQFSAFIHRYYPVYQYLLHSDADTVLQTCVSLAKYGWQRNLVKYP